MEQRPAGPSGRIWSGNQRDYDADRIGFLLRNQREFGDVYAFSGTSLVVLDPELIHEVHARTNREFVTEASMFSGRRRTQWLMDTISTTMSNRRRQWRGVNHASTAARVAGIVESFDHVMSGVEGTDVDVNHLMRRLAGYTAAEFCLGADADGEELGAVVDAVHAGVMSTMVLMNTSRRLPAWLPLPDHRRFKAAARGMRALLAERIARRRAAAAPEEPRDLLDTLLAATEESDGVEHVALPLSLTLRASYSIPGAALAWSVRELARRPDCVKRLRVEAEESADPRRPYAEAFVKEILRLYPPSWLGGREVREDTSLGEYRLSAGDQVMFSPYVVHRDPRFWDDPETFDPDRWLAPDPPHTRHAYFPFGAGPRICIGNQLGMLELVLHVSQLAVRFDIDVPDADSVVPTARVVFTPEGLRARFTPRDEATCAGVN